MNLAKAVLFSACIALCTAVPAASVYKTVDENGNTIYTDQPRSDARPVDLPPLSTYPAPDLESLPLKSSDEDTGNKSAGGGYSSLVVTQPGQEATVRDNTGAVEVQASLAPDLNDAAGHRFQFYLDGKPVGEPLKVPKATIENVDRGEHEVQVAVVDAAGNVLKRSDSVRFYQRHMSQKFPYGPKPPPKPTPR